MAKTKLTPAEAHQKRIDLIMTGGAPGKNVVVDFKRYGIEININLKGILKGGNTKTTSLFYRNTSLNREAVNIANLLDELSPCEKQDDGWLISEHHLPIIEQAITEANAVIDVEAKEYRDNYDAKVQEFAESFLKTCKENRKGKYYNSLWKQIAPLLPRQNEIASGLRLIVRPDTCQVVIDGYLQTTNDLLISTNNAELDKRRRSNLAKRCNPVVKNLVKFSHQIIEGKLHGGTINSYNEAVDILRVTNSCEMGNLPEINDFLKIAHYAVENPLIAIDACLLGFMSFYYTQGLLDEVPYNELDENFSRSAIIDVGADVNNSFSAIKNTLPEQLSMFND